MLIAAARLVDRWRHERSRAEDLHEVRRGLVRQLPPSAAPPEEVELARRAHALKAELARAMSGVLTCGSCAKGHPLPHGRWSGGHCCGARTEVLFTSDELAMLRLSGTRPLDLVAPRAAHAGCAFRGPTGCSLAAIHRPALCVRYVCSELARELAEQGLLDPIDALAAELADVSTRFARLRAARIAALEAAWLDDLDRAT